MASILNAALEYTTNRSKTKEEIAYPDLRKLFLKLILEKGRVVCYITLARPFMRKGTLMMNLQTDLSNAP